MSLKTLQDKRLNLADRMKLHANALKADATAEESATWKGVWDSLDTEMKTLEASIKDETTRIEQEAAVANRLSQIETELNAPPHPLLGRGNGRSDDGVGNPRLAAAQDDKHGFTSHREFLASVMQAGRTGRMDERLKLCIAPVNTAGSDEAGGYADPYGGFLLPKGFSPNLLSLMAEVDPIAGRTTDIPMETATVEIPARVDKNHTSSVSGGLRVYRRAETDTSASSRMEFEQVTLRAHALFGLAYATEELLSRSPMSFVALLEAGFRDEFASKLVDERLNGSGVGMMEGILSSPCLVSVAKETGQPADSVQFENIIKMRARCWGYSQAIWLANHDTLPQLMLMNQSIGTGGVPVWQPSAREDAPDMLMGRPIFFTEHTDTVGDQGDIVLGNWSQYLEGTLSGLNSAESIHVRFINHERTFKFWMENDGRCWWRSALTPKNGASTLSPFVVLDARA